MSDGGSKLLGLALEQNPAPATNIGQDFLTKKQECVDQIMAAFLEVLPSNYVSQVNGPFYTLQFQAIAEQLCEIQHTAIELYEDLDFDFTRPEYLFQFLGALVFPDPSTGYPQIDGDVSFRDFLQGMVELLLEGARPETVKAGIELLTESNTEVELIEKAIAARETEGSLWGLDEQFEFEINVSTDGGTRFPEDAFTLQRNVEIILLALRPAHTIYQYRHLFRETFQDIFTDEALWSYQDFHYEDFRKNCAGAKEIAADTGETLTDKRLFTDPTRDFSYISTNATLHVGSVLASSGTGSFALGSTTFEDLGADFEADGIEPNHVLDIYTGSALGKYIVSSVTDGQHLEVSPAFPVDSVGATQLYTLLSTPNFGQYRVVEVQTFPVGDDLTARAYTTSPTGLTGSATVEGGAFIDSLQDFGASVEGEILTLTEGPNSGSYLLQTLLGSNGGPVGESTGPATSVRPAPSTLRVDRFMSEARTDQDYRVVVDRMGVRTPNVIGSLQATGTVTLASNPSPGAVLLINGLPLLAVAGSPGGDEFQVGATVTETAANIADAINEPLNSFELVVSATSDEEVVTITAVIFGILGESITLGTTVPLVMVLSGGTLAGSADGEDVSIFFVL